MEYYYKKTDGQWSEPFQEKDILQYQEHQIFVRVYNYSGQCYVRETLQQKQLKLSVPSKMNDPFECLPEQSDKSVPLIGFIDEMHRIVDRTVLFRSFTRYQPTANEKDNLLWSHYAAEHTGVRIEYVWQMASAPDEKLQGQGYFFEDVNYANARVVSPENFHGTSKTELRQIALGIAKTKSRVWQYENEVRLFVTPRALQEEYGIFAENKTDSGLALIEYPCIKDDVKNLTFLKLQPHNIVSIDFGCRCCDAFKKGSDEFKQKILNEIKVNYKHVIVREARLPRNGYILEYRQIFPGL